MKLAKKQIFYIFLFALLFKPLWIFEIDSINTQDDLSYWLHGATLAIDFDIDYQNDYKLNSSIFHPSTNTPFTLLAQGMQVLHLYTSLKN